MSRIAADCLEIRVENIRGVYYFDGDFSFSLTKDFVRVHQNQGNDMFITTINRKKIISLETKNERHVTGPM